ncbi:MAG TPA: hypothetical protein VD995_09480 [Azospirillum sp.]|nr:hypothetical protein [Azospirillum sp.]
MTTVHPTPLLRRVLLADAALCAVAGLVLLVGAGALAGPLGLPSTLLAGAGVALLPVAAALLVLATRAAVPRVALWAVIAANALWAVESVALPLTGWIAPTGLGHAFVFAQALIVAGFAEVEYLCLRRAMALAA